MCLQRRLKLSGRLSIYFLKGVRDTGGYMAEEKKTILLNGGREVSVTLVTKAHDFLTQLLGGAPAKSGLATLQVVKNTAGKPFVAVLVGGKHVGFLSDSDAQDLFSTLAEYEQNGVVAQAKGTVTASADGTAKPTFRLSLAESGQLRETPQVQVPAPPAEAPKVEPMSNQYCCTCGKELPAGAKFCLECGTPVVSISAPRAGAALPTPVLPAAPRVAPLPGQVAPRAQFSGTPTKSRGWWARRTSLQKAGVIAGAVAILVIVGTVAGTAGDKDEAVVSSSTTVAATVGTSVSAPTSVSSAPATATTAAPTTTQAPTTTVQPTITTTAEPTTTTAKPTTTTAKPQPLLTRSQKNALESAKDYLAFTAFSRKGLIDQLEFEGFSNADATFAVNELSVDWNDQAAIAAEEYLDFTSFSRSGLIEQLIFEGYTREQAEYGVSQTGL